eukprot:7334437-Lingulodinium_polyedra.AAC.1
MARNRGARADPAPAQFMVGDQVFYWRGHSRRQGTVRSGKGMRAERWHGPAIVIGHEANNLWLAHRNATI